MNIDTEALLMFAARREHIAQVIAPALAAGAGSFLNASPTRPMRIKARARNVEGSDRGA